MSMYYKASSAPTTVSPPSAFGIYSSYPSTPNPNSPFSSTSVPPSAYSGSPPSSGFGFGPSNSSSPATAMFGAVSTTRESSSPSGAFGSPLGGYRKITASPSVFGARSSNHVSAKSFRSVKEEDAAKLSSIADEFDELGISPDKAAVLRNIRRIHPWCLSSLHLCSKTHRRAAYEHLVQVLLDLKAIGVKGDTDSYYEIVCSLDDLEAYGFEMEWLGEKVVQLHKNASKRMDAVTKKEANRKSLQELLKKLKAIEAELTKEDDPAPGSVEFLSAFFS